MASPANLNSARKAFADITGALEDVALLASEGQSVPEPVEARRQCERLIVIVEACLDRLNHLRRRLE